MANKRSKLEIFSDYPEVYKLKRTMTPGPLASFHRHYDIYEKSMPNLDVSEIASSKQDYVIGENGIYSSDWKYYKQSGEHKPFSGFIRYLEKHIPVAYIEVSRGRAKKLSLRGTSFADNLNNFSEMPLYDEIKKLF